MVKDIKLYIMTIEKELGYVCPILEKKVINSFKSNFWYFIAGSFVEYDSIFKILLNKIKKNTNSKFVGNY